MAITTARSSEGGEAAKWTRSVKPLPQSGTARLRLADPRTNTIGERWDVIHDTVGTRHFGDVPVALAEGGRYVSGVRNLGLLASMLWTHRVGSRRALFSATGLKPAPELRERLGRVAGMLVDGSLRLPIERHYPLADIAEVHRYIDGGHKRGNLVIDMIGVLDREDENIATRGVTSEPVDGHDKRGGSTAAGKTPS